MKLDSTVRLVMLQFSFSNIDAVPQVLFLRSPETDKESSDRQERKAQGTGEQIIAPTEKCCLLSFIENLETVGYELVDATYQARQRYGGGSNTDKNYHAVRFTFARHEFATPSEDFLKVRDRILVELGTMCCDAFWRVRAYSNSFFLNGEEVAEQVALSINLEARVPLYRADGSLVTQWQKDENGERIGDAPVSIKPDHYLSFVGGLKLINKISGEEMIGDLAKSKS